MRVAVVAGCLLLAELPIGSLDLRAEQLPSASDQRWAETPGIVTDEQNAEIFARLYIRWYETQDTEQKIALAEQALALEPALTQWPVRTARERVRGELWLGLGDAYYVRRNDVQADNFEKAISAYQEALKLFTHEAYPERWASTQNNLGAAYQARIRGVRADNIEKSIAAYQAALTVRTREADPRAWAQTQHNLANAYNTRVRGVLADNLESAIAACEAALTVRTHLADPLAWAQTLNILGNAYAERVRGVRAENIEKAIQSYEAVLAVRTRDAFPEQWAATQNNLGNVYSARLDGVRADNLEKAIAAYESALTVRTREFDPQAWAATQINLAGVYSKRSRGVREDNVRKAITIYEAVLTVMKREEFPQEWASAHYNLALIRQMRMDSVGKVIDLKKIIVDCEAALTVFKLETFPRLHLRAARVLGGALTKMGDWRRAGLAYASARQAFLVLFGQGLEAADASDLITEAGTLFAEAAFAAVERGENELALELLNEGKARLMAVALRLHTLELSADERRRLDELRATIRTEERTEEVTQGIERNAAVERLAATRSELLGLVKKANETKPAAVLAQAREVVNTAGTIIAPIVTEAGGKVLIVTSAMDGPALTVLDLPDLTADRLKELLVGDRNGDPLSGWFGAYAVQYLPSQEQTSRIGEWRAAIEGIGPTLWALFAGRLDSELQRLGVKPGGRVVWLPTGALGFWPLGLARDPASGRQFIDAYEIAYAPSLDALGSASRQLAQVPDASLAAAVNPTGNIPKLSLPFSEVEGALVASHFADKPLIWLDKSNATPAAVLTGLKGKSYWHFSSHGFFDWNDARGSGLRMKDEALLTVGALLDAEDSLGRPRLVVMSACETGLYDVSRSPDEFVGLPATFMQLGAAGVLSALWQVDDLATMLLMTKFYDLHLDQKLAPATALKQAQAWLRAASKAELIAFSKAEAARAKLDPSKLADLEASLKSLHRSSTRGSFWNMLQDFAKDVQQQFQSYPFAHPYYWGGFIYVGL